MRHTVDTLLTRLDTLGYPNAADTLRDAVAHSSLPEWTGTDYAVAADIADSAAHGATRADIYRALRVVNAIAKRVS
jgi:hypothetical protein